MTGRSLDRFQALGGPVHPHDVRPELDGRGEAPARLAVIGHRQRLEPQLGAMVPDHAVAFGRPIGSAPKALFPRHPSPSG
jgi:hypothetical protein